MERAYHLPQLESLGSRPRRFGKLSLSTADLSVSEVRSLIAALRAGSPRRTAALRSRARTIARAARRFLDGDDPLRRRAVDALSPVTGFSREMIEEGLRRVFEPLTEAELARVAESADGKVVALVGLVSAGNIPGVALPKMALALAAGSSCLVKTASGEPLLAVLFAEAISSIDPWLGSAVAALWWEGGDRLWPAGLTEGVDTLVAYGSDAAITSVRATSRRPFFGHGHKLSLAVVRLDVERARIERMAADAAIDVALYDQLGCLSPQSVYLTGGDSEIRRAFVEALAGELERLSRRIPRGEVPESARVAVCRLQGEYEWKESQGGPESCRGGSGWTVLTAAPEFQPSPLYRTIFIRTLESVADLPAAVGRWLERVESVGLGPWPDPDTERALRALGIPRVAPLGQMQSPGLDWQQGGLDPMAGIRCDPAAAESARCP